MGRHARGIEDTKQTLVASAWELFAQDGYEATSIEAIIQKTGVSKGAFYHHFRSKEDMLDAVAERMTAAVLESYGPMKADDRVPAIRKISGFLGILRAWRVSHLGIVAMVSRALYGDGNLLLRTRINEKSLAATQGAFADVIRQGVAEGVFDVRDPEGTARMLLQLSAATGEDTMKLLLQRTFGDETVRMVMHRLELVLEAFERLLAIPAGSLERPDKETMDTICQALAGKEAVS